jgi:hypothetical protein
MKKKQRAAMIIRVKPIIFARKLAGINLANLPKPTSSERESICLSGEALGRFSAKGFLHELKLLRRDAGGIGIGRFNECLDRGWNKNWIGSQAQWQGNQKKKVRMEFSTAFWRGRSFSPHGSLRD